MKNEINLRIEALRAAMSAAGIDAVIIPQTDPHQSEYLADHWQVRRWLSGFTGSAGSLVVTADKALLWTDSRYFIQAADQLDGTGIVLMKDGLPDTPSITAYLCSTLPSGATVGVDGMLLSAAEVERMTPEYSKHGIKIDPSFDIIDNIWHDRPPLPKEPIFIHGMEYAGQDAADKLAGILAEARGHGADATFISALDEIAWALNIRSRDVKYNPVVTAYLFVGDRGGVLFTDPDKADRDIVDYLLSQGVMTCNYADIKSFIANLPADMKVLIEPASTSATLAGLLGDRAVKGKSPVALAKACRNEAQIRGIREAMVRDGIALAYAMMEVEKALAEGRRITEMDVDALLLKHRSAQPLFFDESFGTIAGYGPHGAIVHYEADEASNAEIRPEGLLLIDSGAQYLDGTTDITRTIACGTPTAAERHDFTLVMKGHIALARMVFPEGTRGTQLDAVARQYLWREGLAYLHGTGHGVGHFLNVHEGPQGIRLNDVPTPLMPGMVTSNEPGLYREGIHGIRCENLMLTVPAMTTEFGRFLRFETITLFPFDLSLFETGIMTGDEIAWVNDYHATVRETLSPGLDAEARAWLAEKTRPLPL